MRKIKALLLSAVLVVTLLASPFAMSALAASCRVQFTDPSVTVGDTVTVNVGAHGDIAAATIWLTYDTSMLEFQSVSGGNSYGGGGSVTLDNDYGSGGGDMSFSITFRTLQTGSTTISCSSYDIVDSGGDPMSVTMGSSVVSISAPPTASSDATLAGLSISPGSLSPSFSSGTTSYYAYVSNSVTSVAISASKNDSGASVYVEGGYDLSVGDNTIYVYVTAEDGRTQKTYTITVNRAGSPNDPENDPDDEEEQEEETKDASVVLEDGTVMKVIDFSAADIPAGFKESTLDFDGSKARVIQLKSAEIYAIYLEGDDNHPAGFYFYNPKTGVVSDMSSVAMSKGSLLLLDAGAVVQRPAGYSLSKVTFAGEEHAVFVPTGIAKPNHYIVYAVSAAGNAGLYLYDVEESTFQRYQFTVEGDKTQVVEDEPADEKPEETPDATTTPEEETINLFGWDTGLKLGTEKLVTIILIALAVMIVLAIVVLILAARLFDRNQQIREMEEEARAADKSKTRQPAKTNVAPAPAQQPRPVQPKPVQPQPRPVQPRPAPEPKPALKTKQDAFTLDEIMNEYGDRK